MRSILLAGLLLLSSQSFAADAPDGTQFTHPVISIDGPDLIRVRFCGLPLQVKLATVQLKSDAAEKLSQDFLKTTLKPGTQIRLEIEPDAPVENALQPKLHVFLGAGHVNLELIKRGCCASDGRSRKYAAALQAAYVEASNKKLGIWAEDKTAVAVKPPVVTPATNPAAKELPENPPPGYNGAVVADLNSKEYHFPGSRFAKSIRAGAKIEYKSLEEAERAGKVPSPFSFPERAKAMAEKTAVAASGGAAVSSEKAVENAKKAYTEALGYMQEARKASKNDNARANEFWKRAGKLLSENLDRITPIADAMPNDKELQKLTEEMSMNLYSCNKYQSL